MIMSPVKRALASVWRQSSTHYGGRSWPLAVVMLSNLSATVLFGGGLMLLIVAAVETIYAASNPDALSWFTAEASTAITGLGVASLLSSAGPMILTASINKLLRRRCGKCGR